jgi:surface antigen
MRGAWSTSNSRGGKALGAITVAAALTLALAAPGNAASVTVSGTVRCMTGAKVVGVWVQSTGGGSKFASRWAQPRAASVNGYSARVNSGSIELHVGCGGSTSEWDSDQWTPRARITSSRGLNALCSGRAGVFRKVTCAFPARPNSTARPNLFDGGNCTWYAAEKWRGASSRNPSWSGNALEWNENAAAQRWTVVGTPAPRSVVVFEPNIQGAHKTYGHVAWVHSVTYRSDGWYVNISEMNFTGFGRTSTRTVKHVPGMSYIWAPG